MDFKPFKIGKYLLLERLATGGMAEVYRATARGAGGFEKQLAIKRILPTYASNEEFRRMFEYEARLSSMLTHSNIVQIYDFEKSGDDYLLAMEYVNGKNLRQFVNKARKMNIGIPVELSVFLLNEVCKGLEYAHQKKDDLTGRGLNIIHRDMSPQNIMLSYEGAVKIVDFGIAKAKDRVDETRSGVIKGKFSYMSPEQANGEPVDHRSDIFSTGIILYELLTGRRLFAAENDLATLKLIQECVVKKPTSINPKIPAELERIILKVLTKDLKLRYQSAGLLNQHLQEFLAKNFSSFTQREVALILQTVFAQEISQEKKRFEQLHQQSIPFSQGVQKKQTDAIDQIEDMLEGSITKSEHKEVTAVTSESVKLPESIMEPSEPVSISGQDKTMISESTNPDSLLQEEPSIPTKDQSITGTGPHTGPSQTGPGMPLADLKSQSQSASTEANTADEAREDSQSKSGTMPILTNAAGGSPTFTPTPALKPDSTAGSQSGNTQVKQDQSNFLLRPDEFLQREKQLNRFKNSTMFTPTERREEESEPVVAVETHIPKKRRLPQFEMEGDFSLEREQYRSGPRRVTSFLAFVFLIAGTIYLYRFMNSGQVNTVIEMISPRKLTEAPDRVTPEVGNTQPAETKAASTECVVEMDSDPRGAKIIIGGKDRGTTSTSIIVPCKQSLDYTLVMHGYERISENIFTRDRQVRIFKSLKRIPMGEIEIEPNRNVQLYIDGEFVQDLDANAAFSYELTANRKHTIRFKNEVFGIDIVRELVLEEGKKERLTLDEVPPAATPPKN